MRCMEKGIFLVYSLDFTIEMLKLYEACNLLWRRLTKFFPAKMTSIFGFTPFLTFCFLFFKIHMIFNMMRKHAPFAFISVACLIINNDILHLICSDTASTWYKTAYRLLIYYQCHCLRMIYNENAWWHDFLSGWNVAELWSLFEI